MGRRRGSRSGLERERARRRLLAERGQGDAQRQVAMDVEEEVASAPPDDDGRAGPALASWPTASQVRRATLTPLCEWCGAETPVRLRGPLPRWCSPTGRDRDWVRTRALRALREGDPLLGRPFFDVPTDTSGWLDLLRALSVELARAQLDRTVVAGALEEMRDELVGSHSSAQLRVRGTPQAGED